MLTLVNISLLQIVRYTTLHLSSLFISIIILTKGDFTHLSKAYLGKVCGTSLLLFIGTSLLVSDVKSLQRLKNWQYGLIITGISNFTFLPLLTLISQQERLSLWLPVWLIACFVGLGALSLLLKKGKQWLWAFWSRPIPGTTSTIAVNTPPFLRGKTVLLYGATSALGQAWLDSFPADLPKKILLVDSNLSQLSRLEIQLQKIYPELEVHSFLSHTLTLKTVQSIFNSYKPDVIFDFDRYYCLPKTDDGLSTFIKSNILIPYWLATNAHQLSATLMISLHPELIQPEASLIQSQKILISALQQFDSSKLRIINFYAPLFIEDPALFWYLEKLTALALKQTVLGQSRVLLSDLLTLSQQLIQNPGHHGALWSSLFIKKLSLTKLKNILKLPPIQGVEQLCQIPETKTQLKSLIATSHPRLAILNEELYLTLDIDTYFLKLETILRQNPDQLDGFLTAEES